MTEDACNIGNALELDGLVVGLDRSGSDDCPITIDPAGSCGCVEVDLGSVVTLQSVSVWAAGVYDACGTPCDPNNPLPCGTGDDMSVLVGVTPGAYTVLANSPIAAPTADGSAQLAEQSFVFGDDSGSTSAMPTPVRYIAICRQSYSVTRDDVVVDFVRGCM